MRAALRRLALAAAVGALASCTAPGGPGSEPATPPSAPARDGGATETASDVSVSVSAICSPPEAEPLPGREVVPPDTEGPAIRTVERTVFVTEIITRFKGLCGACHVDQALGSFKVAASRFSDIDLAKVKAAITSDDALKYMPPPNSQGKPWSQRKDNPNDPVALLLAELEEWSAKGRPADTFTRTTTEEVSRASYAVSAEMADHLTNMGSCIPQRGLVATNAETMDDLDARFAAMEVFADLPENLSETDLVSMDAGDLARSGVVAFAPGYPLWSEDSGKMRAIRVPRGSSVKFDKATQAFEIPDNTRFYKTFLKRIVGRDGKAIWRKIETRLIVTRPDQANDDGTFDVKAIFGTYAWNADETSAVLVRDPLRNGQPFADRVFPYVADEERYQKLLDTKPRNVLYELNQEANKGILRHYAIPGKQRCVECHQGSPMANFVLGFLPVQIRRRPSGEAGVYEEVKTDELNQLQRLIDYGVISGVSSPSDIRGLELPQGDRSFRNKYELTAQAYLLGNCAHCHNPRGFPSVKSPELAPLLDFLPSDKGGIFQFPLDRVSPLRKRGIRQNVAIPYITPSLRDYPAADQRNRDPSSWLPYSVGVFNGLWIAKWVDCKKPGQQFCGVLDQDIRFIAAPWRSLMYRNVDTPYIYADDFAVFPHMPRHSAGIDCRAPRFLADWMVSIPALHKPDGRDAENTVTQLEQLMDIDDARPFDLASQPYEEIMPGDIRYPKALQAASERMNQWRHGGRYNYCPDQSDIVIPEALTTTDANKLTPPDMPQSPDIARGRLAMPKDGVPDRAHLVASDITDVAGEWTPRRSDWKDFIVNVKPLGPGVDDPPAQIEDLRITAQMRSYARTPVPFGLWKAKPECDFTGVKKVNQYSGSARAAWMDHQMRPPDPAGLVYEITPGQAIFNNICLNCHGKMADSKGLLAEAISEMSGGEARVANFKEGLLGPSGDVLGNVKRVFGPIAVQAGTPTGGPATAEDLAVRYMTWMALGGTQRTLPAALLKIVGATLVVGQPRPGRLQVAGSPNMLELARSMCSSVLAWDQDTAFTEYWGLNDKGFRNWSTNTDLIDTLGDAEMWNRICTVGNRPVVRVPRHKEHGWVLDWRASFFYGEDYGKNPVMNERGQIDPDGITWDNLMPTCVHEDDVKAGHKLMARDGKAVPTCPPVLFSEEQGGAGSAPVPKRALRVVQRGSMTSFDGRSDWAIRGAANAGVAVFVYLQEMLKGGIQPRPAYDRCEELKK